MTRHKLETALAVVLLTSTAASAQTSPAQQWIAACVASNATPAEGKAAIILHKPLTPPKHDRDWCVRTWNGLYPNRAVPGGANGR
jgi:hypothetical protein